MMLIRLTILNTKNPIVRLAVLKAGENRIRVSWGLNATQAARVDDNYTTVKVKLCYAPISQTDRAWRKTKDEVSKDKTCQFNIVTRPYTNTQESFEWEVERDTPSATYFVRAYAYDSNGHAVAYGQTTNKQKTSNLFIIEAITGRHTSIDIAAACFSAFSVISLFGCFFAEKRKAKKSSSQSN